MDYYERYREIIDAHPSEAPASPALSEIRLHREKSFGFVNFSCEE